MNARDVFTQSNGEITKRYYAELTAIGTIGLIATCLFRAQKTSTRAKLYRGGNRNGRYRDQAYEVKQWSMGELCKILLANGSEIGFRWGWKEDPAAEYNVWVLYVDIPDIGQVSFHSPTRGTGPDYPGDWDHSHASEDRILRFCDDVFAGKTTHQPTDAEGEARCGAGQASADRIDCDSAEPQERREIPAPSTPGIQEALW